MRSIENRHFPFDIGGVDGGGWADKHRVLYKREPCRPTPSVSEKKNFFDNTEGEREKHVETGARRPG